MTFGQKVWDNKVKIIAVILAFHTQLMVELAGYAVDMLVDPLTVRLVGTAGTLFSVLSFAAGWSNTTKERVAQAAATVAVAQASTAASMETAINATPPGGGN
jgi:hypothetical protein